MDRRHIDPARFRGELCQEELAHLCNCRYCQENLADFIEEKQLITAPADFKQSVMERSKKLDVQLIAGANQISKRLQLFYFSLKVGAAILCALTLLILAPDLSRQIEDRAIRSSAAIQQSEHQWDYYEKVGQLTEWLYDLPTKKMEVFNHDKKER